MAPAAHAHIASNGFLTVNVEGSNLTGAIELAMRDAELAVGLDSNRDGRLRGGRYVRTNVILELYVRSKLSIGDGRSKCPEEFAPVEINERVDGNYLWLPFSRSAEPSRHSWLFNYHLMQDIDPTHCGLLTVTAWGATQTGVLGGGSGRRLLLSDRPSAWRAIR